METIGVITYPFISGLYYLAESFKIYQESLGKKVYLFPKKSFIYKNNRWSGVFKYEINNFLHFEEDTSYSLQLINYMKKYNIQKIVSFETFMRDSSWIEALSALGVIVIDVPMPEWSFKDDLYRGKYLKFSEVYCLTNQSYSLFKDHSRATKISWDFCPDLEKITKNKSDILTLYHPGSNSDINQKNTPSIIKSLSLIPDKNIKLLISGNPGCEINDKRIKNLGKKISRREIYSAYYNADCILSPSLREGLGMSFFEAKKFDCDIITSDIEPMREHSKYLCKISGYNQSDSLIPFAIIEPSAIAEQINKYYEDFYGTK